MKLRAGSLRFQFGLSWLLLTVLCVPAAPGQDKGDGKDKSNGKEKDSAAPGLVARCERKDAIYGVGEKAKFLLRSTIAGEAIYQLSNDGAAVITQGKVDMEPGEVYGLTGSLDKPGFLQLRVQQGKNQAIAAAAFDPTRIEPTAKMPADFDAFWEAARKELAAVPMDPLIEPSPKHTTEHVNCYKISLANVGGKRVRGWLSVPTWKGSFPAILTLPAAGVGAIGPDKGHARLGALAMNIIIHDISLDENAQFYKAQAAGALKDYRDIGMDDRDKSYFRTVILGCVRCIDYLESRPDFNKKDLAVTGGSQGGGLTLITSGLDPRVTVAAPNIPGLCDHSGLEFGRPSGWPRWLARAGASKAKVLEASAYYDAVNFARKFKGKSLFSVGFVDTVCAPTTVFAAYNVQPEPKRIIANPFLGHNTDPRWSSACIDFWKKNMKLVPGK